MPDARGHRVPDEPAFVATTDGLRLAVWRHPPAGVPRRARLVLVHGYAEHAGRYGMLVDALCAAGHECVAFDLRGHGRSEGPRGHVVRFTDYLDDLDREVLEQPRLIRGLHAAAGQDEGEPQVVEVVTMSAQDVEGLVDRELERADAEVGLGEPERAEGPGHVGAPVRGEQRPDRAGQPHRVRGPGPREVESATGAAHDQGIAVEPDEADQAVLRSRRPVLEQDADHRGQARPGFLPRGSAQREARVHERDLPEAGLHGLTLGLQEPRPPRQAPDQPARRLVHRHEEAAGGQVRGHDQLEAPRFARRRPAALTLGVEERCGRDGRRRRDRCAPEPVERRRRRSIIPGERSHRPRRSR